MTSRFWSWINYSEPTLLRPYNITRRRAGLLNPLHKGKKNQPPKFPKPKLLYPMIFISLVLILHVRDSNFFQSLRTKWKTFTKTQTQTEKEAWLYLWIATLLIPPRSLDVWPGNRDRWTSMRSTWDQFVKQLFQKARTIL